MQGVSSFFVRSGKESGYFQHSSRRRAAVRANLRKFQDHSENLAVRANSSPGFGGIHAGMAFLLIPLILGFMVLISVARVLGGATRWVITWAGGFLAGGLVAWGGNWIGNANYSATLLWAGGGFLGLVLFSSLYGMSLEWVFWFFRHEDNPYAGTISLSPDQETARREFARSLHWPTGLASACGALVFSVALFPLIAGTNTAWPSVGTWSLWGAVGLAVQGLILGCFLGAKRNRVVFDGSKRSLGESLGWQLAGEEPGWRSAVGWGLGYAVHQLPTGAMAGLVLGLLIRQLPV